VLLLIDNYDSFVHNLARYFVELGCEAIVLRNDAITLDEYDEACAAAGLEFVDRFATWEGQPFAGGDYAVSVHRR